MTRKRETEVIPYVWEDALKTCPCLYDQPCGDCAAGRCDRCQHQRKHTLHQRPATYILDRLGSVVQPTNYVYEVGYSCTWTCSCLAAGHHRRSSQLDLFEAAL